MINEMQKDNAKCQIDDVDMRILSILDQNCRTRSREIAKTLKISRQTVEYRIKKLRVEQTILKDYTIFDTGVLGFNWYRVLIRLLNIENAQKEEIMKYLSEQSRVTWLGEVGGRWDIAINFACNSPVDFNELFEKISVQFGKYFKEVEVLVYIDIFDFSRTYLDTHSNKRMEFFHRMSKNEHVFLDTLDGKIISEIQNNGNFDYAKLARKLSCSRNTVKKRIDRLIKNKIILGFRSLINLKNIGYQSNMLFLQINNFDRERESELYLYLKLISEVTYVVKHVGRWKIGLEIETKSSRDFQQILSNIRSVFSDIIADYDTFPLVDDHIINYFPSGILETLKQT